MLRDQSTVTDLPSTGQGRHEHPGGRHTFPSPFREHGEPELSGHMKGTFKRPNSNITWRKEKISPSHLQKAAQKFHRIAPAQGALGSPTECRIDSLRSHFKVPEFGNAQTPRKNACLLTFAAAQAKAINTASRNRDADRSEQSGRQTGNWAFHKGCRRPVCGRLPLTPICTHDKTSPQMPELNKVCRACTLSSNSDPRTGKAIGCRGTDSP